MTKFVIKVFIHKNICKLLVYKITIKNNTNTKIM